jgi:ribosomal protein S18 acetylase RimI-like enzyme
MTNAQSNDQENRWRIRVARHEDVDALVAMRLRLDEHLARSNARLASLSKEGRARLPDRYRRGLAEPNTCVLVAERHSDGGLIGMLVGCATMNDDLDPSRLARIDDVWVEPSHRRQGICRALVKEVLAFFRENAVQTVDLFFVVGNAESEYTWHHLGFRPVLTVVTAPVELV